jgi:protein-L-isoaspartate(D-aspartate) O-methyltransferase
MRPILSSGWLTVMLLAAAAPPTTAQTTTAASARRDKAALERMVDEEVVAAGIKNPRVVAAMRATPRQEFVPLAHRRNSFFDMALPLGEGQSISPPFVVAYMTEQLDPQPTDKVLEIGTGSGYQAAVLSPLARDVYTIEIVEPLGKRAAETLARLGYQNVHPKIGDGYKGWPDFAPFDRIIVTCSPERVPQPLVDQLREGGRLIVPLGERFQQTLYLFKKVNGKLQAQALEPTMFVPMTGTAEQQRLVKPDGTRPALLNGSFEEISKETRFPSGWYYLRYAKVQADPEAPDGKSVITFNNNVPGRSARALQAFAIDGRAIKSLDVSLWVKATDVRPGTTPGELPRFFVGYFDELRAPTKTDAELGPWSGTFDWRRQHGKLAVPKDARMAIVWIGLLGATGEISFDHITLAPAASNPSALPARGPE